MGFLKLADIRNIVVFCIVVACFLWLAGCASTTAYDAQMNSLIGRNTTFLIKFMGKPSAKKIMADGKEVWAYTNIDNVYVPSEFYLYNQGTMSEEYDGLYAPFMEQYDFSPYEKEFGYIVKYYCQTSFLIEYHTVIGWSRRGNGCVAR